MMHRQLLFRLRLVFLILVATTVRAWVLPYSTTRALTAPSLGRHRTTTTTAALLDGAVAADPALLLSQLDNFWQNFPYLAAAVVCGVKASAADLIAQTQANHHPEEDPSSENGTVTPALPDARASSLSSSSPSPPALQHDNMMMDGRRNLAFALYGALYQGLVHEYVFNTLYPSWFGTGVDLDTVFAKVAFNLFVQTTFVTLPLAYILTALVKGNHNKAAQQQLQQYATASTKALLMDHDNNQHVFLRPLVQAIEKYRADILQQGLLWKCYALWGPVQCITFSIVPEHYRVTFMAMVSFFWLILLSSISHTDNDVVGQGVSEDQGNDMMTGRPKDQPLVVRS